MSHPSSCYSTYCECETTLKCSETTMKSYILPGIVFLLFSTVTSSSACTELAATSSGDSLKSPNYPDDYASSASDCWIITSDDPLKEVVVLVEEFTTYEYDDYLEIYDGNSTGFNVAKLARWSHYKSPGSSVASSGPTLYLGWNTNDAGEEKGFHIEYISIEVISTNCFQLEANETTQVLYSPGFTYSFYSPNSDVCWLITGDTGTINLMFGVMQLDGHWRCGYDNVSIYEGNQPGSTLVGRYCGDQLPDPTRFEVTGNQAYIRFRTDSGCCRMQGFSLYYSTEYINPTESGLCEYLFTEYEPQYLSSFNYPDDYPSNTDACYTIQISNYYKDTIYIDVLVFDLEDGEPCVDYVRIYEGSDTDGRLVAELCGTVDPFTISVSEVAHIVFHSNADTVSQGFRIKYAADPDTMTHYIAMEAPQSLTSPSFPDQYPSNAYIEWVLKAVNDTSRIEFNIGEFQMEGGDHDCEYDFLEIRDGPNSWSTLQALLCGEFLERNYFYSSGSAMYLRFVTDSSKQNMGFSAQFYILANNNSLDTCAVLDVSDERTYLSFESPEEGYPSGYEVCWLLISRHQENITVFISNYGDDYDQNYPSDVQQDYCGQSTITLYDGDVAGGTYLMRRCSSDYFQEAYLTSSYAVLVFTTQQPRKSLSFSINFKETKYPPFSMVGLILGTLIPTILIIIFTVVIYRVCTRPTADSSPPGRYETMAGIENPVHEETNQDMDATQAEAVLVQDT